MAKRTIRGRRITIDLDLDKELPKKQAKQKLQTQLDHCITMLNTYPIDAPFNKGEPHGGDIDIRPTISGGRHIVAWSDRGLYKHELLLLRRLCGDDEIRIELDRKSHRQKGVLFDKKTKVEI